jgi:hypothetical protein
MDGTDQDIGPGPDEERVANQGDLMTSKEVTDFLRVDWIGLRRFVRANPTFPKPVVIGMTTRGKEIKRYKTIEVLAYLRACPRATEH